MVDCLHPELFVKPVQRNDHPKWEPESNDCSFRRVHFTMQSEGFPNWKTVLGFLAIIMVNLGLCGNAISDLHIRRRESYTVLTFCKEIGHPSVKDVRRCADDRPFVCSQCASIICWRSINFPTSGRDDQVHHSKPRLDVGVRKHPGRDRSDTFFTNVFIGGSSIMRQIKEKFGAVS